MSILDSGKKAADQLVKVEQEADKEVIFQVDQEHVEVGVEIEKGRFSVTGFVSKGFTGMKDLVAGARGRFRLGKKSRLTSPPVGSPRGSLRF